MDYESFCLKYRLDPDAPDSRECYRQWADAYNLQQGIVGAYG